MFESLLNIGLGLLSILKEIFDGNSIRKIRQAKKEMKSDDEKTANNGKRKFFLAISGMALKIIGIAALFGIVLVFILPQNDSENIPTSSVETTVSIENTQITETISSEIYVVKYSYPKGEVYTGWLNDSNAPNGEGKMIYINGDTYDGEWKDGARDGQGTYTWNSGAKYIGDFVNDVREGTGDYLNFVDPDGRFSGDYHGEFKNNQFEGEGTFEFTNGEKFMGIFKANQRWTGTQYNADGEVLWEIENGEPMP